MTLQRIHKVIARDNTLTGIVSEQTGFSVSKSWQLIKTASIEVKVDGQWKRIVCDVGSGGLNASASRCALDWRRYVDRISIGGVVEGEYDAEKSALTLRIDNDPVIEEPQKSNPSSESHIVQKPCPPHEVTSADRLVPVGRYRKTGRVVKMHVDAADSLQEMMASAEADGIHLVTISGFRGMEKQSRLYQRALKKYGSAEAAARVVAPPGHSEHHTGRVVDLGDKDFPRADVEVVFEKTPAFAWLTGNAARFGFELSYDYNDASGMSYEPWHWRYSGRRVHEPMARLVIPNIPRASS